MDDGLKLVKNEVIIPKKSSLTESLPDTPSSPAVDVVGISGLVVTLGLFYERAHQCLSRD